MKENRNEAKKREECDCVDIGTSGGTAFQAATVTMKDRDQGVSGVLGERQRSQSPHVGIRKRGRGIKS